MSATEDPATGEVRGAYAKIGDQRLHYVATGEGAADRPAARFPEFWYGWRQQIQPLAAAAWGGESDG
jgi:epoxide hydrolase 4